MAEVTVTVQGEADLMAKLRGMPDRARQQVRDAVVEMQYRLQSVIRSLLSDDVLHVRTGLLRNSITVQPLEESADRIAGPVTANAPYAAIQEYGGTITPRTAQFLTIPIGEALTGVGVARFTAREIIGSPGLGGFKGTFFAKGVLFGSRGAGDIVPLFALKRSVTLPARPYMSRGLSEVSDQVHTRLSQALQEAIAA